MQVSISEKGKGITLRMEDHKDMSKTCGLTMAETDWALQPGTLGRGFTTVGGTLEQVYRKDIYSQGPQYHDGQRPTKMSRILILEAIEEMHHSYLRDKDMRMLLAKIINAEEPFILNTQITKYERTWQQNEELGLNDMKVENYIANNLSKLKKEKRFEEVAS
ncbi:hypothetical protein EDD16DRAFT_1519412 [Pisolithus croceorrhizus]|nr:hypothetical protein EDD16DRAFT_1519412 [Pisolithus croceorrhizus]KAI6120457.1 hypothetical protein EV401DRAFT_1887580 [Pisolithus croceorrhizus]KAI6164382.1 hypothetical protein EDD17DRAFT_1506412 [Pisolithus thermaeus]